jgi:alkylation response protein AidB-like acyl-CoA dehydrogenase
MTATGAGQALGTPALDRPVESLDAFRLRARAWLAENMPLLSPGSDNKRLMDADESGVRSRQLQRTLFDGGFAGLCFPVQYGGQGLSRAYQDVFTEETRAYQMPALFNVPTFAILAATLLDFGTEEQKGRHIPAILRGDELWVQFLSEPSGGSDLAGVVTSANRDGDVFILRGSKIWSTGAFRSDYAMCLARTDWQATKHRGLTMFILKIHQPGIEIQQIRMVNGANEFCQEFFDDVALPATDVLGTVNDGWTVATRLLYHERDALGGGSPYISGVSSAGSPDTGVRTELVQLARQTGQVGDHRVRQLVAEARINDRVKGQLSHRIESAIQAGLVPETAGSIPRLFAATAAERWYDIALEIAGPQAGAWLDDGPAGADGDRSRWGDLYLMRQAGSLGGGSNEMQRNLISERMLGMPREPSEDRDRPFAEVRHNTMPARS